MSSDQLTTATTPLPLEKRPAFAPGSILANRYRIDRLLGRGGMGEVCLAYDLKLRVEVALKALLAGKLASDHATEILRAEVRNARRVVSPNVCRVFDLCEANDRDIVAMEYIDGFTLREVLTERGPLPLQEAQEIASQILSGLDEIHRCGLIHRDFKPSNIMLTRTGRAVVMDFGLARNVEDASGSISGTPPYMSPEHLAGERIDVRADIFSAGVVLAEMVNPTSRESLWSAIRDEGQRLPATPWSPVLKRALAKDPMNRFGSAMELLRALEEVTLRSAVAEELNPYPGLASFTTEDSEYFFGREAEIEQLWRKLEQPHLHALIGPSGAGKSSLLRAGLIPTAPAGWQVLLTTPGAHPFSAMAQSILPRVRDESTAIEMLLRFEEPDVAVSLVATWRSRHEGVLIIVDQFEELFTLNPPDVQDRFARLLGRLAVDADAHLLVSLRDDFLVQCHRLEDLHPIFSELTPLSTPSGTALRRAIVQPALRCGYRFEDEQLIEEIAAQVEGERGALPLMAFAMSRLWQARDRDRGLLTRQAYESIGGVAGALAQHAESTMERIGAERVPIVRELFRNLVTAQGTRAVRDRDELLSVFSQEERPVVNQVLDLLIDARLLTSYEL
jgi:serine/threonine protein kinase